MEASFDLIMIMSGAVVYADSSCAVEAIEKTRTRMR
jgi:hypothetical protein